MRGLITNVWYTGLQKLSFVCMLSSSGILWLQLCLKTWFLISKWNSTQLLIFWLKIGTAAWGVPLVKTAGPLISQTGCSHLVGTLEFFSCLPQFPICKREVVRLSDSQTGTVKLFRNKYWWDNFQNSTQSKVWGVPSKPPMSKDICFARRPSLHTELEAGHLSYNLLTLSKSLSCYVSPFPNNIAIRLIFTYLTVT